MRAQLAALVVGGIGALAVGAWALRPLTAPALVTARPATTTKEVANESPPEALDRKSFEARLWVPPPAAGPAATTSQAADPARLRLQLIGVTQQGGRWVAALYDTEKDCLHVVADGDEVRGARVKSVSPSQVELVADGKTVALVRTRAER